MVRNVSYIQYAQLVCSMYLYGVYVIGSFGSDGYVHSAIVLQTLDHMHMHNSIRKICTCVHEFILSFSNAIQGNASSSLILEVKVP